MAAKGFRTFINGSFCLCLCLTVAYTADAQKSSQTKSSNPATQLSATQLSSTPELSNSATEPKHSLVHWHSGEWSNDIFRQAGQEKKFVLLDLEAIWCHWCHVMDQKTYSDPKVAKMLEDNFIAVKVDQDSRPDLSNKYGDYGWPATVLFDSSGKEVDIETGFVPPERMLEVLDGVVHHKKIAKFDLNKEPVGARTAALSADLRHELEQKHIDGFDTKLGAWGTEQKYLDWDSVEYAMTQAMKADKAAGGRAKLTLDQQKKLIDPVWGGVYQYSTHGDWQHPHFEKIMQMQAENLRIYALAYLLWNDASYLQSGKSIAGYLESFLLSPEGAFYTSQDADLVPGEHSQGYFDLDDAGRRKQGVPRVDKHIYARENGWAIKAFAALYAATGESSYKDAALKAANYIIENRALADGGIKHDAADKAGPFLGDTLAMGRAFLSLYEITADRAWLQRSQAAADFIGKNFSYKSSVKSPAVGFGSALTAPGASSLPNLDENVAAVRYLNLLYQYCGRASDRSLAQQGMRYLASNQTARTRRTLVAGILLANQEINKEPFHLVTVGAKGDQEAAKLFGECLRFPASYKRVEWFDAKEGKLPNTNIDYPVFKEAAVFFCGDNTCSAPMRDVESVKKKISSSIKL